MRRRIYRPVLAVLLALALVWPLAACQICLPFPKDSVVDFLLAADAVVFAREDPDEPFSLKATEILVGDSAHTEIDLFLDSNTRRLLKVYPGRQVVCIYRKDGEEPGWRRIGVSDKDMEPLLRDVLEELPSWRAEPGRRPAYFAPHLGHENRQLATLAHLEVARAPYADIKKVAGTLPREDIHAFLRDVRYLEWHALYILLLAQSGHPDDHALIVERVRSAEELGSTLQLPAWATAWIEIGEEEALEFIEEKYFKDPDRTEEAGVVMTALSEHGSNGHVHLRDRIMKSYEVLLANHPSLVVRLLPDLTAWERWELSPQISEIAAASLPEFDGAAQAQLRAYLRRAAAADGSGPAEPDGNSLLVIVLGLLLAVPIILGITSRFSREGA